MLSIERVKEILGSNVSDEEAEKIRDGCQSLAEIIFEQWLEDKQKLKVNKNQNGQNKN